MIKLTIADTGDVVYLNPDYLILMARPKGSDRTNLALNGADGIQFVRETPEQILKLIQGPLPANQSTLVFNYLEGNEVRAASARQHATAVIGRSAFAMARSPGNWPPVEEVDDLDAFLLKIQAERTGR